MAESNSTQWRKFLQPVVTGLVALMAAATLYLQRQDSGDVETRVKALEVQIDNMQPWRARVDDNIENFRSVLSDIRSDVSFIRGKMESK